MLDLIMDINLLGVQLGGCTKPKQHATTTVSILLNLQWDQREEA